MQSDLSPEEIKLVKKLKEKYALSGQDLEAYLEGRLYEDYVPYWDYIHLDTLLSLQKPKTPIPDEQIFIMYHQVTELYFKMVLHEMYQMANAETLEADFFVERMERINRYFKILTDSFTVMGEGMEQKQFLQFRMALLPASGFQSAQYRMVEIAATAFNNLVHKDHREKFVSGGTIAEMYKYIYWQEGATQLDTGKKTLTLEQFERKYNEKLLKMAQEFESKNLWKRYQQLSESDRQKPEMISALRRFDQQVNVNWPLAHYKTAVKYLKKDPADIAATGGTNWQQYLPPRFQKRIFYPQLWSDQEKEEWGKTWVLDALNG